MVEAVGVALMVRYVLRVLGVPVLSLDTIHYDFEADAEDDAAGFGGGSCHNFERDFDPLSPTSHHEWDWEDKGGFGFG